MLSQGEAKVQVSAVCILYVMCAHREWMRTLCCVNNQRMLGFITVPLIHLRQSLIPPEVRLEATQLSDPLVPTLQGTDVTSACGMPSFFSSARDGVQVLVPAQQAL